MHFQNNAPQSGRFQNMHLKAGAFPGLRRPALSWNPALSRTYGAFMKSRRFHENPALSRKSALPRNPALFCDLVHLHITFQFARNFSNGLRLL
jgi:hypothetical protein